MPNKFIHKLSAGYSLAMLIILNTFVALLVLNVILFGIFIVTDHFRQHPVIEKYGLSKIKRVYPDMNESEITALLEETWSRKYIYEPFTQFKEAPYNGEYVNVNTNGFRNTINQGSWPPQHQTLNIFLFGGSTMFGYGVSDNQTVASYLQKILVTQLKQDVKIYNFGRGNYYSTQERILYEKILTSGVVPDVAIFVDGLNDFFFATDEPKFTNQIRKYVDKGKAFTSVTDYILNTSLSRALKGLNSRITRLINNDKTQVKTKEENLNFTNQFSDQKVLDKVIQRYLQNKKLIQAVSKSFGVSPIFVWQPIPTYNYDESYHLFLDGGMGNHGFSKYGYEQMVELHRKALTGDNFLWLADIQKDKEAPLYVDKVHYTASFSQDIANQIANLIKSRSLVEEIEVILE